MSSCKFFEVNKAEYVFCPCLYRFIFDRGENSTGILLKYRLEINANDTNQCLIPCSKYTENHEKKDASRNTNSELRANVGSIECII